MSNRESFLTRWLTRAPDWQFAAYTVGASFSTYFCMYAFRKPFAAATYDGFETFVGLDLKTALVISQVIGYTLSKVIGMKVCSELSRAHRALALLVLIIWAQTALVVFAIVPAQWKVPAILLNGLPLGMIWGLVVRYLEGRRLSELVLAGLSCSYIIASGVVKDVGRMWMSAGVSDVWMPAVTGFCFLPLYVVSVWLLDQVPAASAADIASRTERPKMNAADRTRFVSQFGVGLFLLFTVYFFLTAYRDFRDNYGIEIFQALGYADTPGIFTRTEFPVAIGVVLALAVLNVFRNHRHGLIAVYVVMTCGLMLMAGATLMLDAGLLEGRELWWMVLVGLGSYLAYVPFGTALFERLIASTRFRGNAVFAIYIADSVGYTGAIAVQIYRDLFEPDINRFEFFRVFTYAFSLLGVVLLVASCVSFLSKTRRVLNKHESGADF
ncbi:MAG TPA: hypothetical protein EYG03_24100 [Planctomycetes bacterium]|nr:hypothetical protein [Fuerstiella sp.]HIK95038.1 hypothetical protein [Planctomycetota bacterium]